MATPTTSSRKCSVYIEMLVPFLNLQIPDHILTVTEEQTQSACKGAYIQVLTTKETRHKGTPESTDTYQTQNNYSQTFNHVIHSL